MEINFDTGERLFFSWGSSGELQVQIFKRDRHGGCTVTAATVVQGEQLAAFLNDLSLPLFRRALLLATRYPKNLLHTASDK